MNRNQIMKEMRKHRYTYKEIGEKFGITLERARQICKDVKKNEVNYEKIFADKINRLIKKTDKKGSGCMVWKGSIDSHGYAVWHNNLFGTPYVHRILYSYERNIPIKGFTLHHTCRNRNCVNPNHLKKISASDHAKIHNKKATHCKRGHKYNKKNTYNYIDSKGRKRRHCRKCNVIRAKNR